MKIGGGGEQTIALQFRLPQLAYKVQSRGVIRSRTGPAWTKDRIRVEAQTEDRTGLRPVLDRTGPDKPVTGRSWTGPGQKSGTGYPCHLCFLWGAIRPCLGAWPCHPFYSVHPLFFGARSARAERHDRATIFIQSTGPNWHRTEDRK
uniref:Uncharacterized protein n=2 Tax=Opuntia streptacantha TaxID=393608 RepID=A0A7C9CX34_OPUST